MISFLWYTERKWRWEWGDQFTGHFSGLCMRWWHPRLKFSSGVNGAIFQDEQDCEGRGNQVGWQKEIESSVSVQFSSVAQSCPTLCNPMDCSSPGLPVHYQLPEFTQTHVHSWWCSPTISSSAVPFSSHLQSFPASGSFANESALHTRWSKYWSFSFNISPSNEHPGLISFRMDCLDLLAVQGILKSLLQHHS